MELIKAIYNKIVNYFKPANVKDTPEYRTLQEKHDEVHKEYSLRKLAYGEVQTRLYDLEKKHSDLTKKFAVLLNEHKHSKELSGPTAAENYAKLELHVSELSYKLTTTLTYADGLLKENGSLKEEINKMKLAKDKLVHEHEIEKHNLETQLYEKGFNITTQEKRINELNSEIKLLKESHAREISNKDNDIQAAKREKKAEEESRKEFIQEINKAHREEVENLKLLLASKSTEALDSTKDVRAEMTQLTELNKHLQNKYQEAQNKLTEVDIKMKAMGDLNADNEKLRADGIQLINKQQHLEKQQTTYHRLLNREKREVDTLIPLLNQFIVYFDQEMSINKELEQTLKNIKGIEVTAKNLNNAQQNVNKKLNQNIEKYNSLYERAMNFSKELINIGKQLQSDTSEGKYKEYNPTSANAERLKNMKQTLGSNLSKLEKDYNNLIEGHNSMSTPIIDEYTKASTQYKTVQEHMNKLAEALDRQIECRKKLLTESRAKLLEVYEDINVQVNILDKQKTEFNSSSVNASLRLLKLMRNRDSLSSIIKYINNPNTESFREMLKTEAMNLAKFKGELDTLDKPRPIRKSGSTAELSSRDSTPKNSPSSSVNSSPSGSPRLSKSTEGVTLTKNMTLPLRQHMPQLYNPFSTVSMFNLRRSGSSSTITSTTSSATDLTDHG